VHCRTAKEYKINDALLKNMEITVTLYTGIERTHDDARTLGIVEKYTNSKIPLK